MSKAIALSASFLIIFFFSATLSFSQELSIKEATESSAVKEEKVQYELPYPGLLTDSPLYFLKALRDKIVEFLISDPLKKADFYLLQADKRLNSGVYLIDNENKFELAESSVSKGESYFEKAILKAEEAKKQGIDIGAIKNRLLLSSQKHQEVISDFISRNSQTREKFNTLLKRAEKYEKMADSL